MDSPHHRRRLIIEKPSDSIIIEMAKANPAAYSNACGNRTHNKAPQQVCIARKRDPQDSAIDPGSSKILWA
jgi:hypothetical protein